MIHQIEIYSPKERIFNYAGISLGRNNEKR